METYKAAQAEAYFSARRFYSIANAGTPSFSHLRCPACGSLPGDRIDGMWVEDGETISEGVCFDCAMLCANGELPQDRDVCVVDPATDGPTLWDCSCSECLDLRAILVDSEEA